MLVFRGGLGAFKPSDVANTAAAQGKTPTTVESSHAGTFVIKEHHWTEAYYWGTAARFGMSAYQLARVLSDPASWAAFLGELNVRRTAAGAGLPICPSGAITDGGASCYFDPMEPFILSEGQFALLPPLTFQAFNIPFPINALQGDRYTYNAPVTKSQRALLEAAIVRRSQARFFGRDGYDNPNQRTVYGDAEIARRLREISMGRMLFDGINPSVNFDEINPSVDEMLTLMPDMMLFSINFELNPIQPTPTERTQKGGWRAWITRGGYPLSRVVVTGKEPCSDALGMSFCKSLLCQCPSIPTDRAPTAFPHPSCLSEGVDTLTGKTGSGFWPYVSIPQDKVRPEVQLSLVFNEAGALKKFAEAMAKVFTALAGAMCANQGIAQNAVAAASNKEMCVDQSGKACTKGAPGCVCNKPPIEGQIGAGVFNGAMSLWCQGWLSENLPNPVDSMPVVDPPPPAEAGKPWWAIVGAGLLIGAGAVAFMGPTKP